MDVAPEPPLSLTRRERGESFMECHSWYFSVSLIRQFSQNALATIGRDLGDLHLITAYLIAAMVHGGAIVGTLALPTLLIAFMESI